MPFLRRLAPFFAVAALAVGCGESTHPFVERTSEKGVDFVFRTGATGELYFPEMIGGSVALFDYDQDGDLDIFFGNGNTALPAPAPDGVTYDRLYRQDADGRFTDVTEASGLGDSYFSVGVAVGDVDNNGFEDVYVSNYGADRLFMNQGDGTFEDATEAAGISVPGLSASAAMLDYDRDGFLDIYVTQYFEYDPNRKCRDPQSRPDYCGPKALPAVSDVLLHNRGDGTFEDVSREAGMQSVKAAGLGVVAEDFNRDGWVDLYVANDAYANNLWINRQNGTFVDLAAAWGAAVNRRGQREAGMGVVAEDFDMDGLRDLFVVHLNEETNTLYRRLAGDAGFEDVTDASGLGPSSFPYTGFGVVGFDMELDGDTDIAVANGRVRLSHDPLAEAELEGPWARLAEPNLLYLGDGAAGFVLMPPDDCGGFCQTVEPSRGLASGDLDNDGDVDLVIANLESPARLYYNEAERQGRWLRVRAVDPRLNRSAHSAHVVVFAGDREWHDVIGGAMSYVASSDSRLHFGLGQVEGIDRVEVQWPDGLNERFDVDCVDCAVELRRGEGEVIR